MKGHGGWHARQNLLCSPPMIAHLRGTVEKTDIGVVEIDVAGVGYRVHVPISTWERLEEKTQTTLWISTYVREDRLDLFGFDARQTRDLFEQFITLQGIGPRMSMELCDVPRSLLVQALHEEDPKILMSVKGVGRKTAEKLLIELKSMADKHPSFFVEQQKRGNLGGQYDQDAVAALTQLGYSTADVLQTLEKLPRSLATTEERVTAALRSL